MVRFLQEMKLGIVIPAYNEERSIANVLATIPRKIDGVSRTEVIVVDDNSSDSTYRVAKDAGAHVISHQMNLGAGGATLTGVVYARRIESDIIVTLDGDGQHNPLEIGSLVKHHLTTNADLIIGSRFLSQTIKEMPLLKVVGNKGLSWVTYVVSGHQATDSQSGFRLLSKKMSDILTTIEMGGYEFCSEMIMVACQHNLVIAEVPISTIYGDVRKGGQNPINGINILMRLIYRRLTG